MGYEQDWAYKNAETNQTRSLLISEISANTDNPTFLEAYKKPSTAIEAIAFSLIFVPTDAILNNNGIGSKVIELLDKTSLNGHNTLEGITYTTLVLATSQVFFTKLNQIYQNISRKIKIEESVDAFMHSEYHT